LTIYNKLKEASINPKDVIKLTLAVGIIFVFFGIFGSVKSIFEEIEKVKNEETHDFEGIIVCGVLLFSGCYIVNLGIKMKAADRKTNEQIEQSQHSDEIG